MKIRQQRASEGDSGQRKENGHSYARASRNKEMGKKVISLGGEIMEGDRRIVVAEDLGLKSDVSMARSASW